MSSNLTARNPSSPSSYTKSIGGEHQSVKSTDETVVRRGDGKQQHGETTITNKRSIRGGKSSRGLNGIGTSTSSRSINVGGNIFNKGEYCNVIQEETAMSVECHCKWWKWCRRRKNDMLWV